MNSQKTLFMHMNESEIIPYKQESNAVRAPQLLYD